MNLISALPLILFLLLLVLQSLFPRRDLSRVGQRRGWHNLFLFAFNFVLLRFLIPLTLLSTANWALANQLGVFNLIAAPNWLAIVVTVIVLDFAIYWQHVATHKIDLLWRMHKVHHADHDMDVTTAVRFHPLELVLSLLYKALLVILLGAPLAAVIIFELLLFIGPAFNHSNLAIPARVDAALRKMIATPDVHRAHHSIDINEQNTNYGFFLIWWDRWFQTYTERPAAGHRTMSIGLVSQESECERVDQMLIAPFLKS
ncbi:MAG: sterol desaturase family protein [Gammaproteobacteria bacterium]|nr:sterol desaturase family protein [Gammaproteobacteria bacterium]